MGQLKIPVTVTPDLDMRVKTLVKLVQDGIAPSARRAADRSTICRLAIQDLVDRYEKSPKDLTIRLGLTPQAMGEV